MNANEAKFIGHAQVDGEEADNKKINSIGRESTGSGDNFPPIGSTVTLENWPVGGKVIGHHDGLPIIEPTPCAIPIKCITSYTDESGTVHRLGN